MAVINARQLTPRNYLLVLPGEPATRPFIGKREGRWQVYINDRSVGAMPTWEDAMRVAGRWVR